MSAELWALEAVEQARLVREREVTAREVAESHLRRIDEVNGKLNAVVRRDDAAALAAADRVDSGAAAGPLAGAVATSKTNTDHLPWPNDNGVAALRDNPSNGTAACIRGMENAGLVFVGRTNTPAFSLRFHTGNDLHGETWNPHDRSITPGGSSGGAGVAVATGMCAVAQGNDVGGSIRFPAFCNGILGLRPTIGRMSTGGTNPAGRTATGAVMATHGPLARTVRDLRAVFSAMTSEPDPADPLWTVGPDGDALPRLPKRVTLVLDDGLPMDACVRESLEKAGRWLEESGYDVGTARIPRTSDLFRMWKRIGAADITTLRAMLPGINDTGMTEVFSNWIPTFPDPSAEAHEQAMRDRESLRATWEDVFARTPLVVVPSFASRMMGHSEDRATETSMLSLEERGRWQLNVPALGFPAIAVPTGSSDGAPQGVQIIAPSFREDVLLDAAESIERLRGLVAAIDPAW